MFSHLLGAATGGVAVLRANMINRVERESRYLGESLIHSTRLLISIYGT